MSRSAVQIPTCHRSTAAARSVADRAPGRQPRFAERVAGHDAGQREYAHPPSWAAHGYASARALNT
ncbi:hypothetical protein [Amycolatopsis sp. cmx-4-61]|uniref:hypothetical protein n=1 Tax=Amycolatopsis sp. cmx-4-61 TaxID=2790937 RepID=UPI00397A5EA7